MDDYIQMLIDAADAEQTDTDVAGEYTCTDAGVTFVVTGDGVALGG